MRVVEPLRSELVQMIIDSHSDPKVCEKFGMEQRGYVAYWVDHVCTAINQRLEEHAPGISKRSATPMEETE
ncbi:MAG: hypothetical protein ABR949_10260 [Candidatus Aquilonibacter sp.]|jgi:hypothetical protein